VPEALVSSRRRFKAIVPISGNGLTCLLRIKGYETVLPSP
jgi:hypothetical protein